MTRTNPGHGLPCAAAIIAALILPSAAPATEATPPADNPLETIIVVGQRPADTRESALLVLPVRTGRLSTLPDLFGGAPGVLVQSTFGGIDHPRLSIRGSGLQRGTQPAGRGVELRLDGLPMTYADTSFDFVEWVEPLSFSRAVVLRGGRAVLEGGASLGGIIDFRTITGAELDGGVLRLERGSDRGERAQAMAGGRRDGLQGVGGLSWFAQDGDREFNAQSAVRAHLAGSHATPAGLRLSGALLHSDSEVELPGPLTLAQVEAGSRAAQPANVAGDWRRMVERTRATGEMRGALGDTTLAVSGGLMLTDVEFRRRDVQVEANRDWTLGADLDHPLALPAGRGALRLSLLGQYGARDQRQYLNGGGNPASFTGARGALWADNHLVADRTTVTLGIEGPATGRLRLEGALAWSSHGREISERFPTRAARPAATLDARYNAVTGLALATVSLTPSIDLFAALSRTHEPPTWDVLLTNAAGTGDGAALVAGPNPRRPLINLLDDQRATTAEGGLRGRIGPVQLDATLYRSWLRGELVSTTDPVSQTIISVGNADRTRRWGIELTADLELGRELLRGGDWLSLGATWTWTDARFAGDRRFGDNRLPILPPHVVEARLAYEADEGPFATATLTRVPLGGFADYANTVRADGHTLLAARLGWRWSGGLLFLEGRNLTDERYAATVIAAQNNALGRDLANFAPGEGRAVTVGVEARL